MHFSDDLNQWFLQDHRDLPFRKTREPYKIWISEVMLQQTQVATVIDYYNRFISAFPTVWDLANADEEKVYKLWEGLGYYSRAKNLHRAAKQIVERFNGVFPDDIKNVLELPGVGPYTAGAVLSIAFNQSVPAVDGNVMRVMSRVCMEASDVKDPKSRKIFEHLVMKHMGGEPYVFNQALMELGALICTPKQPKCLICPIQKHCEAYRENCVTEFPIQIKKIKKTQQKMAVLTVKKGEEILIIKRPPEGLMSNLWGFPTVLIEQEENKVARVLEYLETEFGLKGTVLLQKQGKKHVFTHLVWHMELFIIDVKDRIPQIDFPICQWLGYEAWHHLAFPTAFKKQFDLIEPHVRCGGIHV